MYFLAIKTRSTKSRNFDIFPKLLTRGFAQTLAIFPTFLFLDNIGQVNVFYDILERKYVFLGNKNKKLKNSRNWHVSKGLTYGFGWKLAIFLSFFLGNIGHENVFYDSLEQKNGFLGDKNKKFKKSKNKRFSKGVNSWFW